MTAKSFDKDYGKSNANMKQCLGEDESFHAFLVRNNKYLMLYDEVGLNVYDMINDKWLLKTCNTKFCFETWTEERAILITDDIMVVSQDSMLEFYFIGKSQDVDHITNPLKLGSYDTIKCRNVRTQLPNGNDMTANIFLDHHGIICTNLQI